MKTRGNKLTAPQQRAFEMACAIMVEDGGKAPSYDRFAAFPHLGKRPHRNTLDSLVAAGILEREGFGYRPV